MPLARADLPRFPSPAPACYPERDGRAGGARAATMYVDQLHGCGRSMAAMGEITERLEGFKQSGLVTDYEIMVVDDSIRVRLVAPRNQDAAKVKSFVVETLAGLLSESQVNVEPSPA